MQLKQKFWIFKRKSYDFAHSNEFKHNLSTFKGGVLSIICGLVVAGLIISFMNVNPFEYLGSLFAIAFNGMWVNQTFQIMAVLGVAALSVAVAFEAGLFNIGVAGQMILGVTLSTVIVNSIYGDMSDRHLGGGIVLLVFIVCVLSASSIALLSGWLKTQFNIHEVVSTIMLNYIVWYLIKFVFLKWTTKFASSGVASNPFPAGQLTWGTSQVAIPLLVLFACVVIVWFIFRKTVFGFKAKAIGYSSTVSNYAGINVKHKILITMALSGCLAGIASFLNVFTISPNISFGVDNLPNTGYDAIAIALVAFNNAWGVVAVSFLWAIFQSAGPNAATLYLLPVQTSMLIFGFVVYFAAISVVFIRWHPLTKIRLWYAIIQSPSYRKEVNRLKRQIYSLDMWRWNKERDPEYMEQLKIFKQQLTEATSKTERHEIAKAAQVFKSDYQEKVSLLKYEYKSQLKSLYGRISHAIEEQGLAGIKFRNQKQLARINDTGLEKIDQLKLAYVKTKSQYRADFQKFAGRFRAQKIAVRKQYQQERKALRAEYFQKKAKLTYNFELKNERLLLRGQLRRALNELNVQIRDLRGQARLDSHLIRFDTNLSRPEKHTRLQAVRRGRNELLNQYRQQRVALRDDTDAKIQVLRATHRQRTLDLKNDKTPLQALQAEYQNKLNKLAAERDVAIQEINDQIARQSRKIKPLQGRNDLKMMMLLYDQCEKQLSYPNRAPQLSVSEKTALINQDLQLIRQTAQEMIKIAGTPKFKEYDDTNIARRKTRQLIKISHLQYLFSSEKVMLINEQTWQQNLAINEKIVVTFRGYEKENNLGNRKWHFINRNKNNDDPLDTERTVPPEVVQEFIQDLETKYTKARGN